MDSEEVSAGGETSVLVADHLNEMFTNMTELRKVFVLNCKLNEKRDEEFMALHESYMAEFAALGKELEETMLTVRSERSDKRLIKKQLLLTKEELGVMEAQLVKCQRELKYAREDQESKDVEIAGLMNVIAELRVCRDQENIHSDSSDEEEPELSLRRSRTSSRSSLVEMLALSPIPEENPDEIPDYYDTW